MLFQPGDQMRIALLVCVLVATLISPAAAGDAHDSRQILPLLRLAKFFNPQLRINATPWSPPAWMKTGGSLIGGRLIDDPRVYRAYAAYLVKFIQAYRAHGIAIDTIAVQNEP